MEYRIVEVDPKAPYEVQGRAVAAFVEEGYLLHGPPFVWREMVLQALTRGSSSVAQEVEPEKLQRGPLTAKRGG